MRPVIDVVTVFNVCSCVVILNKDPIVQTCKNKLTLIRVNEGGGGGVHILILLTP